MGNSRHDGQLLWNGLLTAPPELAASFLALLEETTFANVMGKKGKSLINREDEFAKTLDARTNELKKIEPSELTLKLLGKLEEIGDVEPGYLATRRDFEDLCGELAAKAVALKCEGDKRFDGTSLLDLISYVMQEILAEIEGKFDSLEDTDQQKLIEGLRGFLASLPEEQQQAFCDALNVEALTDDVVRQAIVKGSLGIGFSAVVSIGGFAFYTAASSLLAGLAGLVGLTLPFAAYTTLSSGIAVLANPAFLILVIFGTIATGWWKGSQKIKQSLYPLVVVQLAAAANADDPAGDRWQKEAAVIAGWRGAVKTFVEKQSQFEVLINERKACDEKLAAQKAQADVLRQQRNKTEQEINTFWAKIREMASDRAETIRDGDWGEAYRDFGQQILDTRQKLSKKESPSKNLGLFGRVVEKVVHKYDNWSASSELESILGKLIVEMKPALDVLDVDDVEVMAVISELRTVVARVEGESREKDAIDDQLEKSKAALSEAKELVSDARAEMRELARQYFGVKKAANDWPDVADVEPLPSGKNQQLIVTLERPLVPQTEEERLRRLLGAGRGDSAFAGLVVGDFLYDYLRIDPLVMEGIDFARAADLSNTLLFAEFANKQAALMAVGEGDSISRLQGYVAERTVAQHMAAAGHDVSFPETSNQAGYDLLIDGQPFQVKCTESASYVREHLEKYPDIPVIVNSEHAEEFADVPGVYVDPALSVTEVTTLTEEGIADGAEVLDIELPWIALAVSAAVEIRDLYYSRTELTNSAINIATDTTGRTMLGTVGAKAGSAVGSLMFGPAGSVVGALGGAAAGGIGGGRLAKAGRAFLVSKESDLSRAAARGLATAAAAAVPEKLIVWQGKRNRISELVITDTENRNEIEQIKDWLQQQMDNDARYFEQRQRELERIANGTDKVDPYDLTRQVLDLIGRAGIHPHRLQAKLKQLFSALKDLGDAGSRYRIRKPGSGNSAA